MVILSLSDSRRLRDYGIDEDSRLFLAVKPTPSRPPEGQPSAEQRTEEEPAEPPAPGSAFITNLRNFLQRHFSAEDVDKIVATTEAVRVRVTTMYGICWSSDKLSRFSHL